MSVFRITILTLALAIVAHFSHAQTIWEAQRDWLSPAYSTLPLAMADVNGDGWDDIISMDQGKYLRVSLSASNLDSLISVDVRPSINIAAWSMAVGDLDRDGISEIILAAAASGIHVFEWQESSQSVEFQYNIPESFFPQASNLVDINQDGYLDLFVCNDNGLSKIYFNNGFGFLIANHDYIDMRTAVPSDNSGNYGSTWVDFDDDGDLDLYLSKCRAGVDDPSDPRRINALYVNDGNNGFTEEAANYGLDIGDQSWVTEFTDLDLDGDLDMVVINHFAPHAIYENINNESFVKRPGFLGAVESFALQLHLADLDNNGYEDILITGDVSMIYYNYGDMNFVLDDRPIRDYHLKSAAIGDINRDGQLDIFGSVGSGINNPGWVKDQLYLGRRMEDHHYISISLADRENQSASTGSRISLYGPWVKMTRTLQAGQSYGISNSSNLHFGLAEYSQIDSLIVHWADETQTTLYDVMPDQFIQIDKSGCISEYQNLALDEDSFCGYEYTLDANGAAIGWFGQSDMAETLELSSSQIVWGIDQSTDCPAIYNPVYIQQNPELIRDIIAQDTISLCLAQKLDLTHLSSSILDFRWSDGVVDLHRSFDEPGTFIASWTDVCEAAQYDTLIVIPDSFDGISVDTLVSGEFLHFVASDELFWFADSDSDQVIHFGDEFDMSLLGKFDELWVEQQDLSASEAISSFGPIAPEGDSRYSGSGQNGSLYFNVLRPSIIKSFSVFTDTAGERMFLILNQSGNTVARHTQILSIGKNVIDMNAILPKGYRYELTTDENVNRIHFGTPGPRLERSFESSAYPYVLSGQLEIIDSNFGPAYYQHYYDWRVSDLGLQCTGPRSLVYSIDSDLCDTGEDLMIILSRFEKRRKRLIIQGQSRLTNITYQKNNSSELGTIRSDYVSTSKGHTYLDLSFLSDGRYHIMYTDDQGVPLIISVVID